MLWDLRLFERQLKNLKSMPMYEIPNCLDAMPRCEQGVLYDVSPASCVQ